MQIEEAISDYLKQQGQFGWVRPKEIIDTVYPKFQAQYPAKDTFKRLVFRALKKSAEIEKNFHEPYYYRYKRRRRSFTKNEIEFVRNFFEIVDHPYKFYVPNLEAINQYPDIPLEKTLAFEQLRSILSRLWKDPRDVEILSF